MLGGLNAWYEHVLFVGPVCEALLKWYKVYGSSLMGLLGVRAGHLCLAGRE